MKKRKSLLKPVVASAITVAMLASMALPVFADDTNTSTNTNSTSDTNTVVSEIAEVTEEDAIVPLDKKTPEPAPADAPASGETPSNIRVQEVTKSVAIDEQMKKALEIAKNNFKIDEKIYTEFYYDVYEYDNKTNWTFNWSSKDSDSYIYINVTDELVTSYNKGISNADRDSFSFATLSKSEAEEKAYEFLNVVFGDAAKHFKVYSNSIYYNSRAYEISFAVFKDGYVNTTADMPSVSIDKTTGEVISYYYYNTKYTNALAYDEKNYSYQSSDKIIKPEQAAKKFAEKIGVELKYLYNFDYATKELKIFPVYTVPDNGKYISAVTGETVDMYSKYSGITGAYSKDRAVAQSSLGYYDTVSGNVKEEREEQVEYTQAETAELDKLKNYISKDKAIEIAKGLWSLSKDEFKDYTQSASLSKNYINQNQYIWNISMSSDKYGYRYCYATVDARNGTVVSYYSYGSTSGSETSSKYKYTYSEAKKIVEKEVKKLAEIYGVEKNFEFADNYAESSEKEKSYSFAWNRVVDGIKFDSNYINVEFDNASGKITSYSVNWFEDAKFPEVKDSISKEEAFKKIAEYSEYFPAYVEAKYDEGKKVSSMSLVYMLKNYWVNLDPYTGEYLNYAGKPDSSEQEPDYDDVIGHWCEEVVTTLTDNGIYVWGGKFEPDAAITTKDFIEYIRFYSNIKYEVYYNYERIYKEYITSLRGSEDDSEISDEKANAPITRQESAKIICELLGYDKLVKMPEYLVYPFDDKADDEYKAYITIIYILGAIEGNGKNSYDATETLTRAEAAQMLYNLLTK